MAAHCLANLSVNGERSSNKISWIFFREKSGDNSWGGGYRDVEEVVGGGGEPSHTKTS